MTTVQQGDNPTEYVPRILFNHCGSLGWSGRRVSELTGMEVVAILEFCRSEGSRQGWNDSLLLPNLSYGDEQEVGSVLVVRSSERKEAAEALSNRVNVSSI